MPEKIIPSFDLEYGTEKETKGEGVSQILGSTCDETSSSHMEFNRKTQTVDDSRREQGEGGGERLEKKHTNDHGRKGKKFACLSDPTDVGNGGKKADADKGK